MASHKERLSRFIKQKFLPSREGRVIVSSSCIYLLLVVTAFLQPGVLALSPENVISFARVFLAWPLVLFAMYCYMAAIYKFESNIVLLFWVGFWAVCPLLVWYG